MKTLKEKRVSLRSLWRGGLVIFCLLALVLASCGDDSDDSTSPGGVRARTIVSFDVLSLPNVYQYRGLEVDLTGIRVGIGFLNSAGVLDFEILDDPSLFAVYPRFIEYRQTGGDPTPVTDYQVRYLEGGIAFTRTINLHPDNFIPLLRINLTGLNTIQQREYYIDDPLDFGGLVLEADYELANGREVKRVIPFGASFHGNYAIRPGGVVTSPGPFQGNDLPDRVHLTFAPLVDGSRIPVAGSGEEEWMPLDAVHYVTNLAWETPPADVGPFFWDDEVGSLFTDHFFWLDRFSDARMNVTYSNGRVRVMGVEEAMVQTRVFLNQSPAGNNAAWWNQALPNALFAQSIPFWIIHVRNRAHNSSGGATHAMEDRDAKFVELYYRGERFQHPVTVYNRLESIEVEQDPIVLDFRPSDNDRVRTSMTFMSDRIRVTGVYSSTADAAATPARREIDVSATIIGTNRGNDELWYFDYDRPAQGTTIPAGYPGAAIVGGAATDAEWNAAVLNDPLVILAQRFDAPRRDDTDITLNVRVAGHGPGSGRGGRGTVTVRLVTNPASN